MLKDSCDDADVSEEVTAAAFADSICNGQIQDWHGRRVIGDLELSGVAISSQLVLQQVVFTGDVNFGQARFERSVDLTGCRFERKLIFADAIVSGTLTLDDVQIGSPSEKCRHRSQDRLTESTDSLPKQKTVAEFNSVRVTGSFSLMHSRVFGSLSCEYAKIDGGFWLDETFVAGSMSLRNSGFSELRTDKKTHSCLDPTNTGESDVVPFEIGGNIDLTGAAVGGDVRLIGVVIGGDLKMQTARIQGGILCRSAADLKESGRSEIGGKAWLLGVETGADVDFSGTYIRGDLIIENARVRQNVWAISRGGFRSQVDGNISLWGSHISGSSIFSGVYCRGNLALDGASIGFNLVVALDIDVRNLEIVMATVGGCITAEAAKIGQNVVLMGLEVGKHCGGDTARANFVGARIDGELTLYREAYIDDILDALKYDSEKKLVSKEAKETAKKKALRTRSVISGNMSIARSRVAGGVVLNGVQIEGTLDFEDAELRADLNCRPIGFELIDHGSGEIVRASVYRASFAMVKVDGDMNLTGLNVRQTSILGGSGDLNLRNSRIQGRLELYPHARAEDVKPVENATDKTVIDGRLWLDGANIGYMIISGESFTKFAENEHKDEPRKRPSVVTRLLGGGQVETYVRPRVRFERAKIGRLHIMDPLPDTVDLSNLEVARWDLPKQGSMDKFTEMLDRSFPFKKSNYFVIENHLHNIGDDELADKVRISMCKRDQRQSYSVWKLLLNRFLETSIAYGTKSQRLVFIMVAWFTLTMWIFGDPKRVEYDISSSPEKPPSHQIVPAKHWNLKDDFILAARLHVPIIGLGLEDRFHAAHYWPELYAAMTLAAHWVMWPLLLASASGIIRKRS